MENRYQFITITYNHEHCIIEHLESIKYQVLKYGSSLSIHFDVVDDSSTDMTLPKILEWTQKNPLFEDKISIHKNLNNLGIKKTFIEASKLIKSSRFKILAGDDLYSYNNVFKFMDYCSDKDVVFSPVIYLYADNRFLNDWGFNRVSKAALSHNNNKEIELNRVPFNAPGSFVSNSILQSMELIEELNNFPYDFEDYPMWKYIIRLKYKMSLYQEPVVYYRRHYGRLKRQQIFGGKIMISYFISSFIALIKGFLPSQAIFMPIKLNKNKLKSHLSTLMINN